MKNLALAMTKFMIFFVAILSVVCENSPIFAAPQVTLSGDNQQGPVTADPNGRYTFVNVPLRRNAVNKFTVTAKDGNQVQKKDVLITQIALDSVVVSKIKTEPLSVQEIEQLVNDGVIDISDPANFNVSKFQIVLTIGREEVQIDVPMVRGVMEPQGEEDIKPISDPGSGKSTPTPVEVIVFEVEVPSIPGEPPPPPIPGVLIIEGRIKTLKEFYSVRLLLMNTSGIFTLHDVNADLVFPDGGLSHTLPQDGIVQFGDILPGDGEVPGQKEREFIIRGDEIGIRKVRVNFGGTLIGPGIPDDEIIPFNGSAEATVEVKGPPEFRVNVIHPPSVVKDVPYEFIVNITNIGETPALYTSFELDVGADGVLVDCVINESTGQPVCTPIEGSAVRNIGHLLPGESTRQSFMINPLVSGPITSCMSQADQNIDLQVFVGTLGCLAGKRPPQVLSPDGIPTVSILPTANMFGVGIDSPVVAFFNEMMNESSINTGQGGSFNVFDEDGQLVPGKLRFVTLNESTVAIWQVFDGITNKLKGNSTYTVNLLTTVKDLQGNSIPNDWVSTFTTTDPTNDITPPTMTLAVEPPVNPNNVLSGQIIRLNAYAADQGTGVSRIEMRMKDTDIPNLEFELIDQKSIFPETEVPYIFSVDSANLVQGHTYQFKATGFDKANNSQDVTLAVIMAQTVAPPTVVLPGDPANPILHGISVTVTPESFTGGVTQVDYFLDSQANPFKTVTVHPYSATLNTLGLALGNHTIKAVVTDGLGQTGQDTFTFVLAENLNEPTVDFSGAVDGAKYTTGSLVSVNGNAQDPLGISGVKFFLDNLNGVPIATSTAPFDIDTSALSIGLHKLYFEATNALGIKNKINDPASILEFQVLAVPPPGPPPAAPIVTQTSFPVEGKVTVKGTSVPGAQINITNKTLGLSFSTFANVVGAFEASIDAQAGDQIELVALNLSQSPNPSTATNVVVPTPPVLDHITVSPTSKTFTAVFESQDVVVTGHFVGGSTQVITSQATFTSNNTDVATVNSEGRITGFANGGAVITANVNGKTAQINITVNIVTMTSISITPNFFELFGTAKTRQLQVVGNFSNGTSANINANQVSFSTTNPSVAIVNPNGLVTTTGLGNAVIIAAVSGLPPTQSSVTVSPVVPVALNVSPNAILFTQVNETRQLAVTVELSDGTTVAPSGLVEYSSNKTNLATVSASGLVTALANGDVTITVKNVGLTATASVVVSIASNNPPPEIHAIDRFKAGEGDLFTIRGANFASVPNDNIVKVNGLAAFVQSARSDELEVIVPIGATTGPVNVEVAGKISNDKALTIYGRIAQTFQITPLVDMAAASGAKLNLPGPSFDFRSGDKGFLSSAPDILAPLSFTGTLRMKIDGGAFSTINPSANAVDLSASFTPGNHTVTLELSESGGKFKTAGIYLIAGPNNTGAISGTRSVFTNGQSRPIPVTFINLKDLSNNPLPDGSKVVVTTQAVCFIFQGGCIASHGGNISNGADSPDGFGLKAFTVIGGRIDVLYEPASASPIHPLSTAISNVQVLPANATNNRTSNTAIAVGAVINTGFDSVGTPRSQPSAVADGFEKIVTVGFINARDTVGQPVPDGVPVLATVGAHCFIFQGGCVASAGGSLLSGEASPDGFGLRKHVITNGELTLQYSPGAVQLNFPDVATSNIQWLGSNQNGNRVSSTVFQVTPVTLSSARSPNVSNPVSVFADTADNRITVIFSDFKDSLGNPVPDGTRVVVTAQAHCFVDPETAACIPSIGGVIVSGDPSPDGFGLKIHQIQNKQIQVVYSAQGVGMQTKQSSLVTVQVLPSNPSGNRIGNRALSVAKFTAAGYATAAAVANPPAVIADGNFKNVAITISNIRDTEGNVVPDGAVVLVTPEAVCFIDPDSGNCIGSSGGVITSGTVSPDGFGLKAHTVLNGKIDVTYDPSGVLMAFPNFGTANIQALPGKPGDLSRIGNKAFLVVPVTLSSIQQATVAINPPSVLADVSDNTSVVTLTNLKDSIGNVIPNGSKVVATPEAHCFTDPATAGCVPSAGGTINSGVASPDGFGLKSHTVTSGSTQITYSSLPLGLGAREAAVANVQVLPAQPNDRRIGNRAFTLAPITLTGFQNADISGAGAIAPNGSTTYTVSNIRDTSGVLIPDGSKIVVTAEAQCFTNPDNGSCVGSVGGSITNGTASPDGFGLKSFTVASGQISVTYQAPANQGTAVLQFLPAKPDDRRIGNRAFVLKSVSVEV